MLRILKKNYNNNYIAIIIPKKLNSSLIPN